MTLQHDELHLTRLLIRNVEICVLLGHQIGDRSLTSNSIPHKDCFSAMLIILCLAKTLEYDFYPQDHVHNGTTPVGEPAPCVYLMKTLEYDFYLQGNGHNGTTPVEEPTPHVYAEHN